MSHKSSYTGCGIEMSDVGYWSRVQENEWCGEFKRKATSSP